MSAALEKQLLTTMAGENCDLAKRFIGIGDVPSARAQLDAALRNCELLESLTPNESREGREEGRSEKLLPASPPSRPSRDNSPPINI